MNKILEQEQNYQKVENKPDGRFYIGDKVYPMSEGEVNEYAYDFAARNGYAIDGKYLVGIVTDITTTEGEEDTDGEEVDGNLEYSITWVNAKTKREIVTSLKCAWWTFEELTDNQTEFLEVFKDMFEEIQNNRDEWFDDADGNDSDN